MSFIDCTATLVQAGRMSRREADDLNRMYSQELARTGDRAAARAAVLGVLQRVGLQQQRVALLREEKLLGVETHMNGWRNARGERDAADGMVELLRQLESEQKALLGLAHADIEAVLHEGRRGAVLGDASRTMRTWQRARMDNIVRELFGQNTGDQAAAIAARAFRDTAERLRQRFNAAGGEIGRLIDWGLPQAHKADALIRAGFQAWRDFIIDRLDHAGMMHPSLGRPMTRAEVEASLPHVFQTITSEGLAHQEASAATRGTGALYRQHADHRFLKFKNADAWLEYDRMFGSGEPFAAMMGYVNTMTRDIAAMEKLGPNPAQALAWARSLAEHEAGQAAIGAPAAVPARVGAGGAIDYVRKLTTRADAMWDIYRGTAQSPVGNRLAVFMSNARNVVSATALSGAILSAPSDLAMQAATRRMAGLSRSGTFSVLSDLVRQLSTANERTAVAAGLIMDSAAHALNQQARYVGTFAGSTWSKYLTDRMLTVTGLTPWTQAGRHAFGLAVMHHFLEATDHDFASLARPFRNALERHGFTAADWTVIRQAAAAHQALNPGETFLRPQAIVAHTHARSDEIAKRYLAMIMRETELAVPSGTLETNAMTRGASRPGTLVGELTRTVGQFKAFGAAVMVLHARRIAEASTESGTRLGGARYAAALLASGTLFGALSVQLKDIAKGKDPKNMADARFWGAALLQGGGLGIYGDFLFAELNRFGGGLEGTVAGPLTGRLSNIRNLTVGNVAELVQGKPTHFGKESVEFVRQNSPIPFYFRAAWDRILMDTVQRTFDPDAPRSFQHKINAARKDYNQEYWWRPGSSGPARGPDISAALRSR